MSEESTPKPPEDDGSNSADGETAVAALAKAVIKAPFRERLRASFRLRVEPPKSLAVLLGFGGVLFVLLIWFVLTAGSDPQQRIMSNLFMPSLGELFGGIDSLLYERDIARSIAATLVRLFQGFGLAILIGVPFGVLIGSFRIVNAFWAPLVVFGRNVPVAALVPLTLMWFGIGESQKAFFIFLASAPFVVSEVSKGIMTIPERYVETAQTLGASRFQIIMKVLVPQALPDIFTGLRFLFGLAFGYIMLAELVNADRGLGFLLQLAQRRGDVVLLFLILILIGLLAFVIDRVLLFFQRGLFPHRSDLF